jgi:hypothetical protein
MWGGGDDHGGCHRTATAMHVPFAIIVLGQLPPCCTNAVHCHHSIYCIWAIVIHRHPLPLQLSLLVLSLCPLLPPLSTATASVAIVVQNQNIIVVVFPGSLSRSGRAVSSHRAICHSLLL